MSTLPFSQCRSHPIDYPRIFEANLPPRGRIIDNSANTHRHHVKGGKLSVSETCANTTLPNDISFVTGDEVKAAESPSASKIAAKRRNKSNRNRIKNELVCLFSFSITTLSYLLFLPTFFFLFLLLSFIFYVFFPLPLFLHTFTPIPLLSRSPLFFVSLLHFYFSSF